MSGRRTVSSERVEYEQQPTGSTTASDPTRGDAAGTPRVRSSSQPRTLTPTTADHMSTLPSTPETMMRAVSEVTDDEEDKNEISLSVNPEIKQYIENHMLDKTISDLIKALLNRSQLPYNPYKGFINRIRTQSERFVMKSHHGLPIDECINALVTDTTEWLTCPGNSNVIWGIESILHCVNPEGLLKYKWIVDFHQKQAQRTMHRLPRCDCRVVSALVGPCVFAGSIIPHPSPLQISLDYLTWGTENDEAVDCFANSVVKDITETVHSKQSIAFELVLGDTLRPWLPPAIIEYQKELIDAVKHATVGQQTILLKCLFTLSEHSTVYKPGTKQYGLTHTELLSDRPDKLHCYTEFPLRTLHTGIFFSKHHAQTYLSVFLPASIDILNQQDESSRNRYDSAAVSNMHLSNPDSVVDTGPSRDTRTRRTGTRRLRRDVDLILGKERVDHMSPDDPKVTVKLRESWKRLIAGYRFPDKLFEIARFVLSLIVMDRMQFVPETLHQLSNLYRSSAAHLSSVLQFGITLHRVLSKSNEMARLDELMSSVAEFRHQLLDFLNPATPYIGTDHHSWVTHGLLGDRRCHYTVGGHIVACDFIRAHFDQCLGQGFVTVAPVERAQKVAECISHVVHFLQPIQLSLIEDSVSQCDVIQSVHFEVSQEYPSAVSQRPATPIVHIEKKTERRGLFRGKKVVFDDTADRLPYEHGTEDKQMLSRDELLLDVETAVKRSTAPARIGRESVLLQYCLDVRLDDTFHQFFIDLLSDPHLPPNPFPKLANYLAQPLLKLQLWHEPNRKICSRLVCKSIQQDTKGRECFVHHIPQCSAYGHYSSLSMIDSHHYRLIAKYALLFSSSKTSISIGNFEVTVDTAVSGFTPLYGRVSPYLLHVELKEHLYIEGPESLEDELLASFAGFVLDDVTELQIKKRQLVAELVIGRVKVDMSDVMDASKRDYYRDTIIDTTRRRQQVFMKAYHAIEWRYVLVKKFYCLHYLSESYTQYAGYFPENPVALYQNVWTLQEKVVRHFVYTLGSDADDPYIAVYTTPALRYIDQQLSQCIRRMDLLNAYRWILTRTLVLKHMDADQIPEVWRMLHSLAGQLEYLHTLNLAMQELVQYELKCFEATGSETKLVRVDGEVLGKMIDAYRQKMESALLSGSCHLGTKTFINQLQDKLKGVMKRDGRTRAADLVISSKVVSVLEDVDVALKPIMHTAAAEIHSLCSNSQQILQSVHRETLSRQSRRSHKF